MNYNMRQLLSGLPVAREVRALNCLLSAEIAAVRSYNLAIQTIQSVSLIRTLGQCRTSHSICIERLIYCIKRLGGEPIKRNSLVEDLEQIMGGARKLSDDAAVAMLLAAEDACLKEYMLQMKTLEFHSLKVVKQELLPAQKHTRQAVALVDESLSRFAKSA